MGDFADYARKDFDKKNVVASANNEEADVQFNVEDAKAFSAEETVATTAGTDTSAPVVTTSSTPVTLGRGLDVGTANLVSSFQDNSGNVNLKIQRNAFIDIDCDDYTRNMLTRLGVQYVVVNGRMVVVGDPAFELANIFNRNTRRPMKEGMISPDEADALPIEKMLLETLLEKPKQPGEICYYSVPAEPIDADMNVVYHQAFSGDFSRDLAMSPSLWSRDTLWSSPSWPKMISPALESPVVGECSTSVFPTSRFRLSVSPLPVEATGLIAMLPVFLVAVPREPAVSRRRAST